MSKALEKKRNHAGGLGGKVGAAIVQEFLQGEPGTVKEIAARVGCCTGRVSEVIRHSDGAIVRSADGTYKVCNATARKQLQKLAGEAAS